MKLGALFVVAALAACAGGSQNGELNGKCFPNKTCNTGLTCSSNDMCVMGIDIDAAIAPDDANTDHDAALDAFLGHVDSSVQPDAPLTDAGVGPDGTMTDGSVMTDGTVMT